MPNLQLHSSFWIWMPRVRQVFCLSLYHNLWYLSCFRRWEGVGEERKCLWKAIKTNWACGHNPSQSRHLVFWLCTRQWSFHTWSELMHPVLSWLWRGCSCFATFPLVWWVIPFTFLCLPALMSVSSVPNKDGLALFFGRNKLVLKLLFFYT